VLEEPQRALRGFAMRRGDEVREIEGGHEVLPREPLDPPADRPAQVDGEPRVPDDRPCGAERVFHRNFVALDEGPEEAARGRR